LDISVSLWKTYSENPADFRESTNHISGLNFETLLPGGFGAASFKVGVGGWNSVRWYRDFVGNHVVFFDHLGRRLYEGRIANTDADTSGVSVSVAGYYAHATDLTHGMIYPASTPKSISDIIEDTVDLADQWSSDKSMIKKTVTDVTPQDFTGEKKLKDAIEAVLKTGDDGVDPVPLHFAIWENRRAYLFPEPRVTDQPSWQVSTKDFVGDTGLSLSRSRDELFNKIQILYDDPQIGQTFTDWFEDPVSQGLFGIREGSMNIGASIEDIANLIGELAIKAYAYPVQSSTVGVSGMINTLAGAREYPYMVRAGSLVRITDYDATVAQLVLGQGGYDATTTVVTRTRYDADSNKLDLEFGSTRLSLDILMARLGMSSGSVR